MPSPQLTLLVAAGLSHVGARCQELRHLVERPRADGADAALVGERQRRERLQHSQEGAQNVRAHLRAAWGRLGEEGGGNKKASRESRRDF